MQEPYYWYILYVRTAAESRVVNDVSRFYGKLGKSYGFEPFCPESEFYYRGKADRENGKTYKKRPLFPGYVFIETQMPEREFLREFGTYIRGSDDVIRLLKSGENNIAMPVAERQRLEYLLCGKRCLTRSVGVIVGDRVQITLGPLKDFEGSITRINRHNRVAEIEIDMFGGKTKAQVALEIVEKRDG